jgi:hypothetical protein
MESAPRPGRFYDARPIADRLSLDCEGFRLIKHDSERARAGDVDRLRREALAYLDDLAPAIKEAVGASWIVPSTCSKTGVIVRSATKVPPDQPFHHVQNRGAVEMPYPNAHMDYTAAAALNLARAENHRRGIAERPFSRLMIVQAWQALSPPPQDRPLTLMDASTLDQEDVFAIGPTPDPDDYSGAALQGRFVVFNPDQRWYYFSNMTYDDVALFKGCDSANLATPPHASFVHQSVAANAYPRESVEGRFFVYFE